MSRISTVTCYTFAQNNITRWNRAGTVACSFDIGGRLFSSHKSGALAAIVAPDGSGSVMDEHGNSVLTLKSTGEALLYNTAGEIEYNFERRNLNEQKVNAKTETLVIYNGSARKKVQKINLCDFCQHNRDAIYEFTLQWVFLDLIVEFSPATWEVFLNYCNISLPTPEINVFFR